MEKSIAIHFFSLNTFLDIIEIPKLKKTFWPYGHFNPLVPKGSPFDE